MASLAGANWHKPLGIIPCLSWTTASCVFTQASVELCFLDLFPSPLCKLPCQACLPISSYWKTFWGSLGNLEVTIEVMPEMSWGSLGWLRIVWGCPEVTKVPPEVHLGWPQKCLRVSSGYQKSIWDLLEVLPKKWISLVFAHMQCRQYLVPKAWLETDFQQNALTSKKSAILLVIW